MSGNPFLQTLEDSSEAALREDANSQVGRAPAPVDGANPFLSTLEEQDAATLAGGRLNLREAINTNPDSYAQAKEIGQAVGLPAPVVERNKDAARQQAVMQEYETLLKYSPKLARQFLDPDFAKLAHDDTQNAGGIENTLKALGGGAAQAVLGLAESVLRTPDTVARFGEVAGPLRYTSPILPGANALARLLSRGEIPGVDGRLGGFTDVADQVDAASDLLAQDPATFGDTFARLGQKGQQADAALKEALGGNFDPIGEVLTDPEAWAGFIGQAAPSLYAAYKSGGSIPFLAWLEGMEQSNNAADFERLTGQQIDPGVFTQAVAQTATINAVLERFGLNKILGAQSGRLTDIIKGTLGEAGTEGLQALNTNVAALLSYNPGQDPLAGVMGSIMGGAGAGAGASTLAYTAGKAQQTMAGQNQQAAAAEQDAQVLNQLSALASASKLRERSPEAFQAFVEAAAADGSVQEVFVDARQMGQALQQSGLTPEQLAQVSPAVAEQWQEAVASGGDLRIPISEYLTHIAPSDLGNVLLPHLKTEPLGMTQAEAQVFMQSQAEQFKTQAEKILADRVQDDAFQQSANAVHGDVLRQLTTVNRFTTDVNNAYAALTRDFYTTMAHRLGETPEALYQRYPLRIQAEGVAGEQVLDQAAPLQPAQLPPHDVEAGLSWVNDARGRPQLVDIAGDVRAPGLSADDRAIEQRLYDKLRADPAAAEAEYNKHKDAQGGRVLNTDLARELSEDYRGNRSKSAAVHEPASWFIKQLYARKLTEQTKEGELPLVLFTAGGTGAGKSTALKSVARVQDLSDTAQIIYDTNLSGYESAKEKIEMARAAGKDVFVALVAKDPVAALGQAIGRTNRQATREGSGRTVPIVEHVKTHVGAIDVTKRLAADYADQSGVTFFAMDNNFGKGKARPVAVASIHSLDYNSTAAAVKATLVEAYEKGQITQEVYEAYLAGEDAGGTGEAGLHAQAHGPGAGGSAQPQPADGQRRHRLAQPAPAGNRGQISFGSDITQSASVISLLRAADLTTFLHESGHFYLEVLADIAARPDAPPQIRADFDQVMSWFGVDPAAWRGMTLEQKREHHERFARGFEAYLFEGKAPGVELNSLFAKFRAWLLAVYKSLAGLNVELTDEVRGVFDRMLAVDEQIQAAEAARGYAPAFESAQQAGMSASEWQAYQELGARASNEATSELQRRSLHDMQWLSNARGRALKALQQEAASKRKALEAEVTAEVRTQPVYAVQRFLTRGEVTGPDGGQVQTLAGNKLSISDLQQMYPPGELVQHPDWQKLGYGKYGMLAKDGLHPDLVAKMFGFTSGDELVHKILEAEPESQVVEGLTDQRMLERYGDLATRQGVERAANEAVHNSARTRFVAAELNALAKATGQRRVLAKAAQEFAGQIIARKKVRDIRPSQYESAEARAAKAAEQSIKKGQLAEAATEKRNQLVNMYAARAAYDALDEAEKGLRYLKKFDNEGTRKKLDPEYLDQVDALLDRFDLRRIGNKEADRRKSLLEWVESQQAQGLEPAIDERLLNEARRMPFRELPVEQLRGLIDTVRNIEHLGRLKHKLLTAAEAREFGAVVSDLANSIRDNAKGTVKERRASDRGPLVTPASLLRNFLADHRKFASLARQMDGHEDAGPLWNYLVKPMNKAGDMEAVEREKATVKLSQILAPILKEGGLGKKRYFPNIGRSYTREERLGIALNMGNETNRERVITGERLTPAQLGELLDTLSKQEWEFVQSVWDYIDSFWPQIADKEKRVSGVAPEKVERAPVHTKYGTYQGGYYPIAYDPIRSSRSEADLTAEVQRQIERGLYVRSSTRRGHTKARAESTGRPLRYDLGVIVQHVDQVVHDLSWHEFLIDANRLLRADAVDEAIREHYGPEILRTMKDLLTDVAVGDMAAQTSSDRVFNHLRKGSTIVGLGYNVATSLLQPLGLTQSIVRVGPKWVAKGAAHWLGDTLRLENSARKVYDKSNFMRLRAKTMQREINEIRNKVSGRDSLIEASYFYMIQKMQLVADLPTWWGGYEKAMAQPDMTEEKAVALADQAVIDSQGAGQVKDLAKIQRGSPVWKLWTNFYSFFNTTYNLMAESTRRTNFKSPVSVALFATDMALLTVIPATLSALIKAVFKGEWDDDDELVKRIAGENLSYLFGTVLLLREASAGAQAVAGLPGGEFGYTGPAGIRFFSELTRLGQQIGQGELDASFWKALNNTSGVIFHYPAGQLNRTVEGVVAVAEGETDNPMALIAGPPR